MIEAHLKVWDVCANCAQALRSEELVRVPAHQPACGSVGVPVLNLDVADEHHSHAVRPGFATAGGSQSHWLARRSVGKNCELQARRICLPASERPL